MTRTQLKQLITEVINEVVEEVNAREQLPGGWTSVIARIDNRVFPMGEDEIDNLADEHHIKLKYLGDAVFGTENLAAYRIKMSAAQGQLDAFIDMLAEEPGIEFFDDHALAGGVREGTVPARHPDDDKVRQTLKWQDGVKVDLNIYGAPVGYKYLGWLNSGIELPETDDWREFYSTSRGHHKTLSPKLKVWYEVDSSG